MTRAADYGGPLLRVRRINDKRGLFRRHVPQYEVEFTEFGATRPSWVEITSDVARTLRPYCGLADGYAVRDAAKGAWNGGLGPWKSLYDADEAGPGNGR